MKNVLICVTASFPYGNKETFFANELPYLIESYDQVIIIPLYNPFPKGMVRELPPSVKVAFPVIPMQKARRIFTGLGAKGIKFFLKEFMTYRCYQSKYRFTRLLKSYLNYQFYDRVLRQHLNKDQNTTIYSYWAEATFFLNDALKESFKVVRMHRTDFYTEVNHGYLPLRQLIYENADLLLPISEDIQSRLISDYSIALSKIYVNRLGVSNSYAPLLNASSNGDIVIVSCSRVDAVKRILMLFNMLKSYDGNSRIVWHHFGDGDEFEQLKTLQHSLKDQGRIEVKLHGWCTQEYIYTFYKQTVVHWFVNVSLHEGIPVSIMEAMSFGIPVIATDVGATREIVNEDNGHLLLVNFDEEHFLALLDMDQSYTNKRLKAYETWKLKYNSKKNYRDLVERLRKDER